MTFLLLLACSPVELPDPANCAPRSAWYPDVDGDGLGEATAVFIGCEAPEGWVTTSLDTAIEAGDTGIPTP